MKKHAATLLFLITISASSLAQEISCSSAMVLKAVNYNLHKNAVIRNTELKEKSILDIAVSFSDFSDSVIGKERDFSCWASVSLKLDRSVTQLLSSEDLKYSKTARQIANDYLPNYNYHLEVTPKNEGYILFKGFHYNILINNDNALKSVELDANDRISYAIYGIAWLSENAESIKNEITENAYIGAKRDFEIADDDINNIYNNLPPLIQSNLRGEMRGWIREKNRKCGKIESLTSPEISLIAKTKAYRCQTEMTNKQIKNLTE
ncbi:lysozyme inhibitor LprI family protein [Hafnia paralvei]